MRNKANPKKRKLEQNSPLLHLKQIKNEQKSLTIESSENPPIESSFQNFSLEGDFNSQIEKPVPYKDFTFINQKTGQPN